MSRNYITHYEFEILLLMQPPKAAVFRKEYDTIS
jgi:hypothetical protein